jgi:hypothetical protein
MQMKYLIETSLVRAALDDSSRSYAKYFVEETSDGTLHTSNYVRMESIRLWILREIRIALYVDAYGNVNDALNRVEQDWGERGVKANLSAVRHYVNSRAAKDSPREAAKEYGRLAVRWLRRFDRVLRSRVPSKCARGNLPLLVDFRTLLADLREFYLQFKEPISDCRVNDLLDFANPLGRTARLLSADGVKETRVGENLSDYQSSRTWITCTQCNRIGDPVIAIEQPRPYVLLSTDSFFEVLCCATGRQYRILRSLVDVDKEHVPSI